jgi:hypothetical protein
MTAIGFYSIFVPCGVGLLTLVVYGPIWLNHPHDDPVNGLTVVYKKLDILCARACAIRNARPTEKVREGTAVINTVGELMTNGRLTRCQQAMVRNIIHIALENMNT